MQAQGLIDRHQHHIEALARMGFLARAVTYAVIGLLAIQVALRHGGKLTDSNGAFLTLASQPFGKGLLVLLGLGFAGYALWRLVLALMGRQSRAGQSDEQPGLFKRIGYGVNGLIHFGLAFGALRLALMNQGAHGDAIRTWSAKLMAMPLGLWAVGIAGLIVAGVGIYELYQAIRDRFQEQLDLHALQGKAREAFCRLAKWGIMARGLVFCLIGWFLVQAAISHNPAQARGLGGALAVIAAQPSGKLLLGIVALGLLMFALYSAFAARYYRIGAQA